MVDYVELLSSMVIFDLLGYLVIHRLPSCLGRGMSGGGELFYISLKNLSLYGLWKMVARSF